MVAAPFLCRELRLRDYRSFTELELQFPPAGAAIIGENGAGKTNLLEAIYYLEIFRSFRGAADEQLVRFGETVFRVEGGIGGRRGGAETIAAAYDRRGRRKKVTIDGDEPPRIGDALGRLLVAGEQGMQDVVAIIIPLRIEALLKQFGGWQGIAAAGIEVDVRPELTEAAHERRKRPVRTLVDTAIRNLVGYGVSEHLRQAVRSPHPLSAGRVQTAALHLLCERERAVADFAPARTWRVEASFRAGRGGPLAARLVRAHGQPIPDGALDEGAAWQLAQTASAETFAVRSLRVDTERLPPPPPFTTASLLRAASERLGLRPAETMRVAQQLYEGVEVEDDVRVGLLTYPRTDGVRVAKSAVEAVRHVIARDFGTAYLPHRPIAHREPRRPVKHEAHEALRPVDFERTPKSVRKYLRPAQYRLYALVYERAVASQMIPATVETTTAEIADRAGRFVFAAEGRCVTARGFLQLDGGEPAAEPMPALERGDRLTLDAATYAAHASEPPERFSEAGLVGAMEAHGIGRPSTYAATLETLRERGYAVVRDGRLHPTDLGLRACAFLTRCFPTLFAPDFTARLEATLDAVAAGGAAYRETLHAFYHGRLLPALQGANEAAAISSGRTALPETPVPCERCGRPMVRRDGPHGPFYGCSGFPACRTTRPVRSATPSSAPSSAPCPRCRVGRLVERTSRQGQRFFGCSAYPSCDYTQSDTPSPSS